MKSYRNLSPIEVEYAAKRLAPYVNNTPILRSSILNKTLGHEILFKCEPFQKTGAFKVRGALNKLVKLAEDNNLPHHIVAFSSGNHSQAVAYAASLFDVKTTIFLPENVSSVKIQATKRFSAEVIITKDRQEAERKAAELIERDNAVLFPPFNDEDIHIGQGTATYEALMIERDISAIFSPIGGGGLVTGAYLAKELLSPDSKIFACEPLLANDAANSLRENRIVSFDKAPDTIADGARTLAIGQSVLPYLKQIDGIFEVAERDILYWTQWLTHLLKINVEPTAALAMAGAKKWLDEQSEKQKILVLLSGGNISKESYNRIWKEDFLTDPLPMA